LFYVLKVKFDLHYDVYINHVLESLNIKWRNHRQELWQQKNDETHTIDKLFAQ